MRRFGVVGVLVCLVLLVAWTLLVPSPPIASPDAAPPVEAAQQDPVKHPHDPEGSAPARPGGSAGPAVEEYEDIPADEATPGPGDVAPVAVIQGQSAWPMTKDGIDGAFREVLPGIRGCYEDALQEVPDLEGGFKVLFRVDDREGIGSVVHVEITDMNSDAFTELHDLPMEDCVMDVMHTLQFDAPADGPVEVRYPLVFNAG